MKSGTSKFLALVLLVILSATVAGAARGGLPRPGPDGPARREIKAYFQANVLPVLRQQRQKLEPRLDAADRAQLATYRTQLKSLKEQGQALRRCVSPAGGAPTEQHLVLTEAQRHQAQQLRSETRTIMLKVAQMAQKYAAALRQLAQEVQPQKEKWTADIKALVSKNATPEQQGKLAARTNWQERSGMNRFFKPVMFLLMDPNAPTTGEVGRGLGDTSFYPNPAAATSQLEYEVKKAGPVIVELLDSNGNELRTLVSEAKVEKGNHTQQLDLRDLPAGTYFYKITTKSGSETKRFVKE